MNHEEHDELWDLLGKAKEPRPSPFFSRNVLRALREERSARPGIFGWLRRRWQFAALAAGGLALVTLAFIPYESARPDAAPADSLLLAAQEVSASPDYQVISNLDDLLDSERNSVWLEASAY